MTDPTSTPPESPLSLRRFNTRPESILPPRAVPAATSSATLIAAACVVAYQIPDPRERVGWILLASVLSWLFAYFTPPPRRHFRRGDP